MNDRDRPEVFQFLSWHELIQHRLSAAATQVAPALEKHLGYVPETLETEAALRIWADLACLPLVDLDLDEGIIYPHRYWCQRSWAKQAYETFYKWMVEVGWVQPQGSGEKLADTEPARNLVDEFSEMSDAETQADAPEPVAGQPEKPRRGRPRRQPVS